MRAVKHNHIHALAFLAVLALAVSCKVTLIAPYDEVTDQKISDLHEELLLNLKEWSRDTSDYNDVIDFYDKSEVTLEMLIERSKDDPKSKIPNGLKESRKIKLIKQY